MKFPSKSDSEFTFPLETYVAFGKSKIIKNLILFILCQVIITIQSVKSKLILKKKEQKNQHLHL